MATTFVDISLVYIAVDVGVTVTTSSLVSEGQSGASSAQTAGTTEVTVDTKGFPRMRLVRVVT